MSKKLLVVDDDPEIRRALSLAFGSSCKVFAAADGAEALRILDAERPRLMLLDMTMPGMSGLEVLRAAKHKNAAIAVIVLTAENDVALAKKALDLGAAEFVTKPFDWPGLKDSVKRRFDGAPPDGGALPWIVQEKKPAPKGNRTPVSALKGPRPNR